MDVFLVSNSRRRIRDVGAFCRRISNDTKTTPQVREGARKVLELIEQYEQPKNLLRPSSEPLNAKELLRPIEGRHEALPEKELLQPAEKPKEL